VELDLHFPSMNRDKFTFTFIIFLLIVVLKILDPVKRDMSVATSESTTALN
jgi:hypothetical protein